MYPIFFEINNTQSEFRKYLDVAAKIIETVAFELAPHESAQKVEDLLALACEIEQAAYDLGVCD